MTGSYFFYTRAVGRIDDRIDSIEQRMTPPAPAVDAKPIDGKVGKGKKGPLSRGRRSRAEEGRLWI